MHSDFDKGDRACTRSSSCWLHLDVYCLTSMLLRVELVGRLRGPATLTALIKGEGASSDQCLQLNIR